MTDHAVQHASSYVTLAAGSQRYLVAAESVTEVVGLQPLTRVPKMPACVSGLMNLRGTVLPVIDLALKLGFPSTEITPRTCIVVVSTNVDGAATPMGVIVDEVIDVATLPAAAIDPPPNFGSPIDLAYLTGITRTEERYVLVLDLTRILAPDEILAVTRRREESTADSSSAPAAPTRRRKGKDGGTARR